VDRTGVQIRVFKGVFTVERRRSNSVLAAPHDETPRQGSSNLLTNLTTYQQLMNRLFSFSTSLLLLWVTTTGFVAEADEYPDVRTIAEDLIPPKAEKASPGAGRRVFLDAGRSGDSSMSPVQAVLMLPENWRPGAKWPVFAELPGNGGYRDPRGDQCTGRPEDCSLGYGLTAGEDWIWLCLPFLNGDGSRIAETWWGDAPQYDAGASLKCWQEVLDQICSEYGGDPECMVLAGFSRGAIAVNSIGLREAEFSERWKAFFPNSHYDGVRKWPFPDSDRSSARERLNRLAGRPQLISGEGNQVNETRRYLQETGVELSNIQFLPTGFRNHTDRWVLRPCPSRDVARKWLQNLR